MERRCFLEATVAASGFGILGCGGHADGSSTAPSYTEASLSRIFGEQEPFYRAVLGKTRFVAAIEKIVAAAWSDFASLAPTIPYVGPLEQPLPQTLVGSGVALSFYRGMKGEGLSLEDAGQVTMDVCEAQMLFYNTPEQLLERGRRQFTEAWYRMAAQFAAASQQRRYPGDWVYSFVQGEAGIFDWGFDYTECGICKLYRTQGAAELIPYLCAQDFIASRHEATGLVRTTTLAQGGICCDFRYRKPVTPNLLQS